MWMCAASMGWPPLAAALVLVQCAVAGAQEYPCCALATGSCRSACEQMSLVTIAANVSVREQSVGVIADFCTPQLDDFWTCLNNTLEGVSRGQTWPGRVCCVYAQSLQCRLACVTSGSRDEVTSQCRHSDEVAFYTCMDRQQAGHECCAHARTPDCEAACRHVFRSQLTPSQGVRSALATSCSARVLQCVRNYTHVTPATDSHRYVRCCEHAASARCRDSCRQILRTHTTAEEIADSLQEGGCGPPLPHDRLWQCFLHSGEDASLIDRLGMDSAKLQCCPRAATPACRRLCTKTFSNEWTRAWDGFNRECLLQLSEHGLAHCMDEVDEPCELGCDGLSFCTHFNQRPTQLFRSCSRQADEAARYDVALWMQQGRLQLPGLDIPVLNISRCSPGSWVAVACSLQLKPCHRASHANRICSADCYKLLSQCVDWSRMGPTGTGGGAGGVPGDPRTVHSAASLCALLSPDHPSTPCVSLEPFLRASTAPYRRPQEEPTAPCRGGASGDGPCNTSQVCAVNRDCVPGRPCLPYTCLPACKLGEVSQYGVPEGTFVRLPQGTGLKDCPKVCQCSGRGVIERCQPLPCFHFDPCHPGGRKISHHTWFSMDCNMCSCYAGEITCSKKQCEHSHDAGAPGQPIPAFSGLPCRCPPHYVPVCGRNGNTYPSSCLAKCAGLKDADFEFGPCSSKDPCERVQCGEGARCVPAPVVCLSLQYRACPQHRCVPISASCADAPSDPVCDTDGEEHPNMCYLLLYGKSLAYRGRCLVSCAMDGPVCGTDGNTYLSECAASAAYVSVDYAGACTAVGLASDVPRPQCVHAGVQCPPLVRHGCLGFTPAGACCPVCAGAVRMLYSHKQVDRVLYTLKGTAWEALTVRALLQALERQVQVAECVVRGYLTVELDLMVLVQAVRRRGGPGPSELQLEACVREAEKLSSLVQRASPRVLSELSLSVLTAASAVHASTTAAAGVLVAAPWTLLMCVLCATLLSS